MLRWRRQVSARPDLSVPFVWLARSHRAAEARSCLMPLFVVRHEHSPETCPARDPAMGAMLLNHLSRPSASRHGVTIRGEAVVRGAHSLFFIAEAADETGLQAFMTPFRQAG